MTTFGHYLRTLRTTAHLSQRALAERLGVSHAYVAQVETGRRGPLLPSRWGALLAIGADIAYHLATDVRDTGPVNKLRSLTGKESSVLALLARGFAVEEIARDLQMSAKTVQAHRNNMRRKLKLRSDVELCLMALKAGFVRVHEAK